MIVATDLRNLTSFMRDTLLNEEMIAIHQDRLAKPGMRIMYAPCGDYQCEIWARPLVDGALAIGLCFHIFLP